MEKESEEKGKVKVKSGPKLAAAVNGVPDAVLRTSTIGQYVHSFNWTSQSGYVIYPMNFAGTSNRYLYVATFFIPLNVQYSTQSFDIGFKITNNVAITYNMYDYTYYVDAGYKRIAFNSTVFMRSTSNNGVFIERFHTLNLNGYDKSNIAKAVIAYIPYLGAAYESYETLTASGATTTNKPYPFTGSNYTQQSQQGKIIKEVSETVNGLNIPEDYTFLKLKGNAVNNVTYGYNYSVYDPVWW